MKLYQSPASPFVRKVMVVLHETGQLDDVELVPLSITALEPSDALVAKNPLSKIPALERDTGPTIYDSRVICAFLDDRAGAKLYRQGPGKWDQLTLEATADGILDAAVLMVYEGRVRPEDKQFAPWVEAQRAKVDRALSAIESRWMPHLTGPLDIGQIAVGCALGYLDFRHGDRDWRTGRPELTAWYETFAKRDSMQATAP
ncbi:glutathione S-transferase [Marinibacterium profundimaris]|uniref:Glutathione S-transferase n=1 Tax=Marinibacterium profundimaris TaxID=1679460 RepID=A0A225NH64_9RHOB|nr:glutathione S-transferase [Marinibacterium profundimaris]OWU66633.1 glutathione S-transferase [Marinibacterium profundimaris]